MHLLIVCGIYASMPEGNQMALKIGTSSGASLFFHIIGLLIYPTILTIIARVSGYNIMKMLFNDWEKRDIRVRLMADTSLGFFIFSTILLFLGSVGFYTTG